MDESRKKYRVASTDQRSEKKVSTISKTIHILPTAPITALKKCRSTALLWCPLISFKFQSPHYSFLSDVKMDKFFLLFLPLGCSRAVLRCITFTSLELAEFKFSYYPPEHSCAGSSPKFAILLTIIIITNFIGANFDILSTFNANLERFQPVAYAGFFNGGFQK